VRTDGYAPGSLMKISQKTEYALRATFDLSLHSPEDLVKVSGIATRQEIPKKFLELILASLRQGGLVEARRGREGGYRLARPADRITVGDVLALVGSERNEKRATQDAFTYMWMQVDESVSAILDRTTFADLVDRWKHTKTKYIPNWEI
jgi:Rrf2 family cysteine metabolism transcriptional repressor